MEPSSCLLVGVCVICVDRLKRRLVLLWISIQGYELFILSMNKSVPGVKPTTIGMKLLFLWYEKHHQQVWNWQVVVWNCIPKVWKNKSQRYEKFTLKGMKMMSKVWKNTKGKQGMKMMPKVWNRNLRYEKAEKGMKFLHKVIKRVLRYEIEVFLKNIGFSYLYGSISYLFGYEKNRCFFLMTYFELEIEEKK